jgi:hypothetical protein
VTFSKEEYKAERAESTKRFKEKHGLPDDEMAIIDDLATVTTIIARFQMMYHKIPNTLAKEMAQILYGVKEKLDHDFPVSSDGRSLEEQCILCPTIAEEGEPCTHGAHMRAALLIMAMFRISPQYDFDVEEDECPDLDAGMVSSDG